jgi:hypothetical protein
MGLGVENPLDPCYYPDIDVERGQGRAGPKRTYAEFVGGGGEAGGEAEGEWE